MRRPLNLLLILLGLAVVTSGFGRNGHGVPTSKPFFNSKFIEIDKMMLHYRIWPASGSADTLPWVFMVHGMGGSTWSWEKNAPFLSAEGYNVVAVDVPPFGYSSKNPDFNQSADSRARLFWDFLERIHPGSVWNLVGHSMGGGIVQAMAIINPDKVNKVIFVDPALFETLAGEHRYGPSVLKFRPLEWTAAGIGNLFFVRPGQIRKLLKSAYATEPDPIDISEYYKSMHQPGFARALIRSSVQSKPAVNLDGKSFTKPALAIWGDKDTWVPLARMQPLLDKLPSVKISVIAGAGHCPMATHADLFNQQVLRFFSEIKK